MAKKAIKTVAKSAKSPKGAQYLRDRADARPSAKAAAIPASTQMADPTPAQVREWWPADRAKRILSIMKTDDISYGRAVKRSRRRMMNDGAWN